MEARCSVWLGFDGETQQLDAILLGSRTSIEFT